MAHPLTAGNLPKIMLANKDYRNFNSVNGLIINIEGLKSKHKLIHIFVSFEKIY